MSFCGGRAAVNDCLFVGAQNLPPPGAYQPIPNFTGVGAGLQFRAAINSRLSGTQPILPMVVSPTFANLPAEQDGVIALLQGLQTRRLHAAMAAPARGRVETGGDMVLAQFHVP